MMHLRSYFFALLFYLGLFSCPIWSAQPLSMGKFHTRTLFTPAVQNCPAPLVILVPDSGPYGPEFMVPGSRTLDGRDASLFAQLSLPLNAAAVGTLAVGKPGVDYFRSWSSRDLFYDSALYAGLKWQDLIDNLDEAVQFAKTLQCVDSSRLYILGYGEGTQVAVDYVTREPNSVKGLILISFMGESQASTLSWQLYRRPIESWLSLDVDLDHDQKITRREASLWPEFKWSWMPNVDSVSLQEVNETLLADQDLSRVFREASQRRVWTGVFDRPPLYHQAVALTQDLYAFAGELDVVVRPSETLALHEMCESVGKSNCTASIVPGLGHGLSAPTGPRAQRLLDATLGPVDLGFQRVMAVLGHKL